ncbi:hypothetical protein [Nocardia sp. NPDC060259]|uniref:hypothetical protein n=1 Tax=Nocardia sp. NPDC060259 TaxID=3347088 RepID=UPI00364E8B19
MIRDGLFVADGDWVRDAGPIGSAETVIAAWLYQDIQGGLDSLVMVADAIRRSSRLGGADFERSGNAWFLSVDSNGVSVENHYVDNLGSGIVSHDDVLDVVRQYWDALVRIGIQGDLRSALERFEHQYGRKAEVPWCSD